MGNARLPRGWRFLLWWILPEGIKEEVLSELDALSHSRMERGESAGKVRRWYRGQVFRALVPALKARFGREYRITLANSDRHANADRRGTGLEGLKQDLKIRRVAPATPPSVWIQSPAGPGIQRLAPPCRRWAQPASTMLRWPRGRAPPPSMSASTVTAS